MQETWKFDWDLNPYHQYYIILFYNILHYSFTHYLIIIIVIIIIFFP
jgi:hypothetical protein